MSDQAEAPVYKATTAPAQKKEGCELTKISLALKLAQLVLSLVAFICEEVIEHCVNCGGLYFFEFVSCSATLLALLLVLVYLVAPLRKKVDISNFRKIDFYITIVTGVLFLIASIVFAATMDSNDLARVSVVFGFLASACFLIEFYFQFKNCRGQVKTKTPISATNGTSEAQPLNIPVQAQSTNVTA